MRNPFRYFNSSPEVIRLAVMMYILSLPFNQSGPNSGSAQSYMADMWIATGPWDRPKVTQPSLKLWFRRGTACRGSEVAGVSDESRPGKTQPDSDRGSDQAASRSSR